MADTKRKDRIAELYQALKKKNKYLAQICGDQPLEDPLQAISNIYDNTFLHLAIRFKQKDMVEELLTMLPEEGNPPLWNIKNKEGNTILHELACSDSMMNLAGKVLGRYEPYEDKRKELEMLLTARNEFGETPIFCAARHGQTEMFKFLAKEMKLKVGSVKDVMSLPEDMKLKELQELSKSQHHLQRDDKTTVLHISITTECFACNPTAFGKNMKMRQGVMEELMISLDPFKELGNNLKKIFNMCTSKDNIGNGDTRMTSYKRCSPILQKLVELLVKDSINSQEVDPSNTKKLKSDGQESPKMEGQKPQENEGQNSNEYKKSNETPLFLATISGIKEIVEEILLYHPKELEHTNRKGMNILQVAILHRQEEIFYMLVKSEVLPRSLFLSTNDQGNSLLHMVGQNTKSRASEKMQNPAFQLRNELLLFQDVKKACKMHLTKPLNNDHQTAEELFAASKENLHQNAKEWLMRTGENCTLLSVFIATVAFAAAYTVPGGPDQNTGIPILKCKPFFVVFIIADVISLTFALTSVGIFLSILTSTFPLQHFETYLLKKLTLGIKFMVFSVSMMAVAFGATIVLIMTHNWESIFWYVVAFLPVPIFFLSYSPLRSAVLMRSTELVKNFVPILLLPFLFPTYGAYKGQRWTKKKFRFCWNNTQSPQSTAARCTPV
ncbi:uncharacterized protein LOC104878396 isoform X2 [Vitis vinifera]|uniref:uncharacterized protein LOC104878396 isoform X2 n=1 Tax=Vitis vinifera TaxID=29760 RepID=UPI002882E840|nr:uncharacterized protein LOC104878396 isoform X2 [Vitis vinifera]